MKTPSCLLFALLACRLLQTLASPSFGSQNYIFARPTRRSRLVSTNSLARSGREPSLQNRHESDLDFLQDISHSHPIDEVKLCTSRSIGETLLRGALLRIASDLSGGTPFESIKTRVTTTKEGPMEAYRNIVKEGGYQNLWTGTESRTVEGALIGAVFMLGSVTTKAYMKKMGFSPTISALAGGLVGGVAQAFIMTPAGMVFTSLNYNRNKPGYENDNAFTVTRRIIKENGILGMYHGFNPMALRQASNWASRAGFTEICRSVFNLSQYGIYGEILSGCIGGVGSCWNTPIETIRVICHRDVSSGLPAKSIPQYWNEIVERDGYAGLFRGYSPRALQAIWQTCFLVVVPNLMGI